MSFQNRNHIKIDYTPVHFVNPKRQTGKDTSSYGKKISFPRKMKFTKHVCFIHFLKNFQENENFMFSNFYIN